MDLAPPTQPGVSRSRHGLAVPTPLSDRSLRSAVGSSLRTLVLHGEFFASSVNHRFAVRRPVASLVALPRETDRYITLPPKLEWP